MVISIEALGAENGTPVRWERASSARGRSPGSVPHPVGMKAVFVLAYVAMAVWLMIASAARIVIQLGQGVDLDALPFIGGALGLLALVLLLPAYEDLRGRRHE